MGAGESDANETGIGREIAREADAAHATTISFERDVGGEGVFWGGSGETKMIIEAEKLFVERRVVCQNTSGIVVDMDTIFDGFDDDAIFAVAQYPVEFGRRKLGAEGRVDEVHFCDESFCFGDGGTLSEQPRDEFELGDIVASRFDFMENGVASEEEASHAEAFFVDGVVEQRIVVAVRIRRDERNSHDSIMRMKCALMAEVEREIAWGDRDGLAIRKFIVEIATKIMIFGSICRSCTHFCFPF